jgi:hypothetical protein
MRQARESPTQQAVERRAKSKTRLEDAQFLNIDLDVRSRHSLRALVEAWPWSYQPLIAKGRPNPRWLILYPRRVVVTAEEAAKELIQHIQGLRGDARVCLSQIMWPIVTHALEFGLVLSAILFGLLLGVLRANPEIMLNDYPPDIRAKWGPMTKRTKQQRVLVAGLLFVVGLGIVEWSLKTLPALAGRDVTFAPAFAHFTIMFGTFNVLDWLVLDCGLVYWQPRFFVLPGTEGMAGYRSYWFHFRGFLIGIPIVLAGSALFAAIVSIRF